MKKTAQFGLNQWEMSDRIQMQDFNADNAAIEAALAARNCRFYTSTYNGTGEAEATFTFPGKPILIVISSASMVSIGARRRIRQHTYAQRILSVQVHME